MYRHRHLQHTGSFTNGHGHISHVSSSTSSTHGQFYERPRPFLYCTFGEGGGGGGFSTSNRSSYPSTPSTSTIILVVSVGHDYHPRDTCMHRFYKLCGHRSQTTRQRYFSRLIVQYCQICGGSCLIVPLQDALTLLEPQSCFGDKLLSI